MNSPVEIGVRPAFSLYGVDGNAAFIIGSAMKTARRFGKSKDWIDAYTREATSGDYANVLTTTRKWFDCEGFSDDE